jgi:hypothetical protein
MNLAQLIASLALYRVLAWNARRNAIAQRHYAVQIEADAHAAQRDIAVCDAMAGYYAQRVRQLRTELRALKIARLFQ